MPRIPCIMAAALLLTGCGGRAAHIHPTSTTLLSPRGVVAEDTAPKVDMRMVPPEVYMRTYLQIFGGLSPLDAQKRLRGSNGSGLFDTWNDYVSALGFPDYRSDIPRQAQTNALMVSAFERLGIALCDRAVEHDIKGKPPLPVDERLVFAFDVSQKPVDAASFASRFDVLHRTFLGYPAALAPPERVVRFFGLYHAIFTDHARLFPASRFSPAEAGWASVCYGLIRHPEFHLY